MNEQSSSKNNQLELFLISFAALFFELIVIRWLGSEIRAFSIFKNFPLISCYIGLGYGLMKSNDPPKFFKLFPVLLLVLVGIVSTSQYTGLTDMLMPAMGVGGIEGGWFDATHPPESAISNPVLYTVLSIVVFFSLFVLIAATMAGLGQKLGSLFSKEAPLRSYLVNLFGSVAGIAAFSLLSVLCTGPAIWLSVGCLAGLWIYRSHKVCMGILAAVMVVAFAVPPKSVFKLPEGVQPRICWSPYHRVDVAPFYLGKNDRSSTQIGYQISVNKGFFQQPLNLSENFVNNLKSDFKKHVTVFRFDQYELPYALFHPKRMLIMGSGTGNDVASALRHGVEHIDAVEIDPMMIKLGKELHPEHPYDSPKVTVYVNDARAFLRQHKDKYDLVMTGFLDSHTVAGNSLSVRLDDYVYTVEGMQDALAHVDNNGLYCITYCTMATFLPQRLYTNLKLASADSGITPFVIKKEGGAIFHLLATTNPDIRKNAAGLVGQDYKEIETIDKNTSIRPSTDDWPFLYLSPIPYDVLYLAVNGCIIVLAWLSCGPAMARNSSFKRWQLFCLGAAFLLLELAIIDRLSLVFGTTWIVNSVCIFAILTAIILSNILIIKQPNLIPLPVMYAALLGTLMIVYFTPVQLFNTLGIWTGGAIAAAISAVPIFFAGMIFSTAFKLEKNPSAGLAFNMMGAVAGGLLEYVGTYTGIRSLLLLAAGLYILSMLCWYKSTGADDKAQDPTASGMATSS